MVYVKNHRVDSLSILIVDPVHVEAHHDRPHFYIAYVTQPHRALALNFLPELPCEEPERAKRLESSPVFLPVLLVVREIFCIKFVQLPVLLFLCLEPGYKLADSSDGGGEDVPGEKSVDSFVKFSSSFFASLLTLPATSS